MGIDKLLQLFALLLSEIRYWVCELSHEDLMSLKEFLYLKD